TVISPFRFESTHHACPDEGDESGTSPPGFDSGVAKPLTVRLPNRFFGRRACRGRPRLVILQYLRCSEFAINFSPAVPYTYIIESFTTGRWYYGSTQDLDERLNYHNRGWNRSTRGRGPWRYIFIRSFQTAEAAREFEFHLKKLRRKEYILSKSGEFFIEGFSTPQRRRRAVL